MLPKAIILLSFIYVVRAGIVTVNAYPEDNEQQSSISEDDVAVFEQRGFCWSWQCDQSCRSMGFAGGSCINSYTCQCRSRSSKPDISLKTSEADAQEVPEEPRSCNPAWCDQSCRRIGRPGGACVNGRCKCDLLRSNPLLEKQFSDNEPEEPRSCNPGWCDQTCRRMGRPGGACVNGRCKCDLLRSNPLLEEQQFSDTDANEPEEPRSCNPGWCDQSCRRIGRPGGACVNGRCKCDLLRSEQPDEEQVSVFEDQANELSGDMPICVSTWCDSICRRRGYPTGFCVNGQCICRLSPYQQFSVLGSSDEIEPSPEARASCTAARCNQICRRLGYPGGVCIRPNVCQCRARAGKAAGDGVDASDIFLVGTDFSSVPELELSNDIDQTPEARASCTAARCNQVCRRLGYPGGVCIRPNVCQCRGRAGKAAGDDSSADIFVEGTVLNSVSELAFVGHPERQNSCVNSECNEICQKLGFKKGVCISPSLCQCSGRKEQSSNHLKTSDSTDVALVRTVRSCGAVECNNFCKKMGYARGVCIGTYCQCRMRASPTIDDLLVKAETENNGETNDIPEIKQV